jgi:hypothetical protein
MALTKVTNNLLELDAAQPSITSTGTLTNFTSTGIDDNATSTAITIDASENVGIGVTPSSEFHVKGDADTIARIEPNNNSGKATLLLSSTGSGDGGIQYDANTNQAHLFSYSAMTFGVGTGNLSGGYPANERMRIDSAGRVTMPSQPAFSVKPASLQTNIAINSQVTIAFGTEVFDVGANFASNTFTAPVTGKYQLNLMLRLESVDTAANFYQIRINTSNRNYVITFDLGGLSSDTPYWAECFSVLADMDASDTVSVQIYQSVGTVQTDINADSNFSGYLVA